MVKWLGKKTVISILAEGHVCTVYMHVRAHTATTARCFFPYTLQAAAQTKGF